MVLLSFDRRNHHHSERKGRCHHATLQVWPRSSCLHRWAIQGPFLPFLSWLAGAQKPSRPDQQPNSFFFGNSSPLCVFLGVGGGNRLTTRMIASMATADNNGAPPPRLSFFLSCPLTASPAFFALSGPPSFPYPRTKIWGKNPIHGKHQPSPPFSM